MGNSLKDKSDIAANFYGYFVALTHFSLRQMFIISFLNNKNTISSKTTRPVSFSLHFSYKQINRSCFVAFDGDDEDDSKRCGQDETFFFPLILFIINSIIDNGYWRAVHVVYIIGFGLASRFFFFFLL